MNRFIILFTLSYSLTLISAVARAEIKTFRAEYRAEYQGLPIKAKAIRKLDKNTDNRFRFVSTVNSVFIQVTETSEFEYENLQIRPLNYDYQRKGLGRERREKLTFDWRKESLLFNTKELSPLAAGTLDKLSLQLKLSEDVAQIKATNDPILDLSYIIADKSKRKPYHFKILPDEMLETSLGYIRTIPIERIRNDTMRQTRFWLSPEFNFLLVKALQIENERSFELNLIEAEIDGQALKTYESSPDLYRSQ